MFLICIKDRLLDRHLCLNLYPCVIKVQSVSQSLCTAIESSHDWKWPKKRNTWRTEREGGEKGGGGAVQESYMLPCESYICVFTNHLMSEITLYTYCFKFYNFVCMILPTSRLAISCKGSIKWDCIVLYCIVLYCKGEEEAQKSAQNVHFA